MFIKSIIEDVYLLCSATTTGKCGPKGWSQTTTAYMQCLTLSFMDKNQAISDHFITELKFVKFYVI